CPAVLGITAPELLLGRAEILRKHGGIANDPACGVHRSGAYSDVPTGPHYTRIRPRTRTTTRLSRLPRTSIQRPTRLPRLSRATIRDSSRIRPWPAYVSAPDTTGIVINSAAWTNTRWAARLRPRPCLTGARWLSRLPPWPCIAGARWLSRLPPRPCIAGARWLSRLTPCACVTGARWLSRLTPCACITGTRWLPR